MIYHAFKDGFSPIKVKVQRINNKIIIETEYKNAYLADIALFLWLDVHKKQNYKFMIEMESPPKKKKKPSISRSIKKLKIRRIMGLPIKEEENEKNNS